MINQTETQISIDRTINASAQAVFAVLVDPRRHPEIDGSGMLQADVDATPIMAIGQTFTMAMRNPALGDYRTENHVVVFEPGRRIAWETARVGNTPPGFRWSWSVEPVGPDRSTVVHLYDWSKVTDPAVLERVNFPFVSAKQLNETVTRLAAVAAR